MKGVSVEIMGQNLTVASEENDEWVKSVAGTVDERIRKLRANGNTVSSLNLAILAALNFADELEHLKKEHQELIDRITAMKERLIDAIDGKLVLEHVDARSQKGPAAG
jgi:cell division protein ZapA